MGKKCVTRHSVLDSENKPNTNMLVTVKDIVKKDIVVPLTVETLRQLDDQQFHTFFTELGAEAFHAYMEDEWETFRLDTLGIRRAGFTDSEDAAGEFFKKCVDWAASIDYNPDLADLLYLDQTISI